MSLHANMFSMGMFCIDEVHYEATNQSFTNVIGGAGTFAAIGAGVHLSPEKRHLAQFILDKGNDFTTEMAAEINSWKTGVVWREDDSRGTTKAWNKFVNNEERLFKYLSPKKQINPSDIPENRRSSPSFHLVCGPDRCLDFVNALNCKCYVYEPVPTCCFPEEFPALKETIAAGVTVLSPNALEAARFVDLPEPETKKEVEQLCADHYQFAPVLVIRCGHMGSYLRTPDISKWYEPYYTRSEKTSSTDSNSVVDATGAGNAFCGALALALGQGKNWDDAMAMANVGASFVIQQIGTPHYNPENDTWNNEKAETRVQQYLERLSS